jgi:SAM-dependent methyltransferase
VEDIVLNREFITKHWYASVYERFENQTDDVEFLLEVLKVQHGDTSQNILEVACGGGRICVPLAQAGHKVTGFDADEYMLLRCYRRMQGLANIRCYAADAITADWGTGFDVVLLAGNILINIESEMDYMQAQRTLIRKAAQALHEGGHLYMDFDLHGDPVAYFNSLHEGSYFDGTDELGTQGRTVGYGSVYDPVTQICAGTGHVELTTNAGEAIIVPSQWQKHIPTQAQVYGWLEEAGFTIERTYLDFSQETVPVPVKKNCRATLWAGKGRD